MDSVVYEKILRIKREREVLFIKKFDISKKYIEIKNQLYNFFINNQQNLIELNLIEKNEIEIKNSLKKALNTIEILEIIINHDYHYEDIEFVHRDIKSLTKSIKRILRYISYFEMNYSNDFENEKQVYESLKSAYKNLSHLISYLFCTDEELSNPKIDYKTLLENNLFLEQMLNIKSAKGILTIKRLIEKGIEEKEAESAREKIKKDLIKMEDLKNPINEYEEARKMNRHFIIHVGETNTGKTYDAICDLKSSNSGAYLAPLRLLAIEIQDALNLKGTPCNLLTGEEEILIKGAKHISSTVEKVCLNENYEVCVIDECQMINNVDRGGAWTRAILGLKSKTIHLCTSPSAIKILKKLIDLCGDTYKVINHDRSTPLLIDNNAFNNLRDVKKGDALVVFSKKDVIRVSAILKGNGHKCSIIYGALPYETRKKQFKLFLEKKTDILVSTDAISMGVNLPIKRVVFMKHSKFDGNAYRNLKSEEVKQIAGRAGRRGLYEKGYVNSVDDISFIIKKLNNRYKNIDIAYLSIPQSLTMIEDDFENTLVAWKELEPTEGFKKCSIERQLYLIERLKNIDNLDYFKIGRNNIFKLCNMYFDEKDLSILEIWEEYINIYFVQLEDQILKPVKFNFSDDLKGLESYYKSIELYYTFSRAFYIKCDIEWVRNEKYNVAEEINEHLLSDLKIYINRCSSCNEILPWDYENDECTKCLFKEYANSFSSNIRIRI